ncbi:hypothetical protein DXG01_010730, partial [Tephrocybe rancida]
RKALFLERAEAVDVKDREISNTHGKRDSGADHKNRTSANRNSGRSGGFDDSHAGPSNHRNRPRDSHNNNNKFGKRTNTTPGGASARGRFNNTYPSTSNNQSYNKGPAKKQLTAEEQAEYKAAGKCFGCGGTGHFSRNCPHGKSAKSSERGKPPGVQSNSIRMDLRETDRLREEALGNTTQSLSVGMMTLDKPNPSDSESWERGVSTEEEFEVSHSSEIEISSMFEEVNTDLDTTDTELSDTDGSLPDLQSITDDGSERDPIEHLHIPEVPLTDSGILMYPTHDVVQFDDMDKEIIYGPAQDFGEDVWPAEIADVEEKLMLLWDEEMRLGRPRRVGHAPARKLEHLLEMMQPYPGDPENVIQFRGKRFEAHGLRDDEIHLWDCIRERKMIVPSRLMKIRHYEVGLSYAELCSEERGVPIMRRSQYCSTLLGNVWAWNAEKILELGAPYMRGEQFIPPLEGRRFHVSHETPDLFLIEDCLLEFRVRIERKHLEKREFDLTHWYERKLVKLYDELERLAFGPGPQGEDLGPDWMLAEGAHLPSLRDMGRDIEELVRTMRGMYRL